MGRRAEPADERALRRAELAISMVLRAGVAVSVALLLAGLVVSFARHPAYSHLAGSTTYQSVTQGRAQFPHSLGGLGHYLALGRGQGLIMLGLAVLILTPVLRVAVGVVTFSLQRDVAMALVTIFVLGTLIASFVIGGA